MKRVCSVLALGLMVPGVNSYAAFTTTGVYDEQTTQPNAVDHTAAANAGDEAYVIGLGLQDASADAEYQAFKAAVAAAYNQDLGGVVTFDAGAGPDSSQYFTDLGGSSRLDFAATYGVSNSKTATFISGIRTDTGSREFGFSTSDARTPISGAAGESSYIIATGSGGSGGDLNIADIYTSDPNVLVSQVGFTVLSRDYLTDLNFVVTATFSGGGTAQAISEQFSASNTMVVGEDDTFVGFIAPSGESITAININFSPNQVLGVDDLAFVTTAVPEPSSLALTSLGVISPLVRRRRA